MPEYLTDTLIKKLEARVGRYEVTDADEPGLRLRVFPTGAKTWSYWYRNAAGATRRRALGSYPGLTLSAARKAARKLSVRVDAGEDPQADRQAARAAHHARKEAPKLSDLCDDFVKDQSKTWRPATRAGWTRFIEADIKPGIGDRIPAEVTTDDVLTFVEALKRKRGAVSVARCYEVLRRVFRWAVARRRITTSPCFGLDARELVAKAQTRSRTYNDEEIRAILAASAKTELRHLLALIFYTATRNEETRSAEWKDIDVSSKVWTVAAEKSKTGEAHRVPLSSGALAVLRELRENGDGDRYLFPAPTRSGFMDAPQKAMVQIRRLSGVSDFRLHDVRRTVRQRLADMGVSAHVGEAILGHLPPKIVRTYTPQWEPLREMAAALQAWSIELQRIIRNKERRGADVVPMKRA